MKVRAFLSLAGIACLAIGLTRAQEQQRRATDQQQAGIDQNFIRSGLQNNMLIEKLAQLAQERAANSDVKKFARRLVSDHARLDGALKDLAKQNQFRAPHALSKDEQRIWQRLSNLHGAEFDRAFVRYIIENHRREFAQFQDESRKGQNPMIRAFAKRTLPAFKEHLRMAEELATEIGQGGAEQR